MGVGVGGRHAVVRLAVAVGAATVEVRGSGGGGVWQWRWRCGAVEVERACIRLRTKHDAASRSVNPASTKPRSTQNSCSATGAAVETSRWGGCRVETSGWGVHVCVQS